MPRTCDLWATGQCSAELLRRHSLKLLRPVKVGDTVAVTGEITEKYVKKGRHYWTLRYRVQNSAGEVCLENLITCSVD